jgi:hypothetical protein
MLLILVCTEALAVFKRLDVVDREDLGVGAY